MPALRNIMAEHNDLGKRGEQMARQFLEDKGYKILAQNWKAGSAEIDIIAKIDKILVFVEVKTLTSNYWKEPEMAITRKKARLLAKAGGAYTMRVKHDNEVRFDVISIVIQNNTIQHFEDAFYPSWDWM